MSSPIGPDPTTSPPDSDPDGDPDGVPSDSQGDSPLRSAAAAPQGLSAGETTNESSDSKNAPGAPEYDPAHMQIEATQLMTAVRMGSTDAFETLFKRVRGSAFHAARSLVGSHEDAQDLTQEAFIKAYKARDSYDPTQPFLPWFHRILRNTCFSFLRKKGRLRERSIHRTNEHGEDSHWDIVDESAASPSDRAEEEERNQTFTVALDKLKARDREIIVLRHYQDLSYKDIAAALSVPEGTVMSRLFHARKRLKGLLADSIEDVVTSGTVPQKRKNRRGGASPNRAGQLS